MNKLLIFDFDGTIVDSKEVYYNAIEARLGHVGINKEESDKMIDLGLSLAEFLKKIGIPKLRIWLEKRAIMKEVKKRVNEVRKCKDVASIQQIKEKKILISNSLSEFILPVLRHLKIEDEFDEIYGADAFDNKKEFIKEYLKRNGTNRKDCYYIGDRKADVILARELGIASVAVSSKSAWNSMKEVLKEKPDFMIFDLKNLKEILEGHQK